MYKIWQERYTSPPLITDCITTVSFARDRELFKPGLLVSNLQTGHRLKFKFHSLELVLDPGCGKGDADHVDWREVVIGKPTYIFSFYTISFKENINFHTYGY